MAELGVYFALRHKRTGQFMPQLRCKGYTFWNPESTDPLNDLSSSDQGTPRLLSTRHRAARCIVQWVAMANSTMRYDTSYFGTDDQHVETKPDGRVKDDLEIVEVHVIEK